MYGTAKKKNQSHLYQLLFKTQNFTIFFCKSGSITLINTIFLHFLRFFTFVIMVVKFWYHNVLKTLFYYNFPLFFALIQRRKLYFEF